MTDLAKRRLATLAGPFRCRGALVVPLLVVYIAINGLVALNCALHDPGIGYDANQHTEYFRVLSAGRLPGSRDTSQFFSPPLPYLLPALVYALTGSVDMAGKTAQCGNALLSIGLTFLLLKTCRLISPRPSLRLGALVFLGILPVYYKTFVFVRGEPYAAFFAMAATYWAATLFVRKRLQTRHALCFGAALGLGALSRQWGILLFPAVASFAIMQWLRDRSRRRAVASALFLSLLVGGLVGGWFYGLLKVREGSAIAFNKKRLPSLSLRNHPVSFYFGLSLGPLFRNPVRPAIPEQWLPLFYAETWGDYWCFFVVYGWDHQKGQYLSGIPLMEAFNLEKARERLRTNYATIGAYLGRVNLVSLYPSALALLALSWALVPFRRDPPGPDRPARRDRLSVLLLLIIAMTMAGYFWYLVMHNSGGIGLRIRATHVLQVFPLLAILVGSMLERAERRSPALYRSALAGLLLVFLHNLGALVTRY